MRKMWWWRNSEGQGNWRDWQWQMWLTQFSLNLIVKLPPRWSAILLPWRLDLMILCTSPCRCNWVSAHQIDTNSFEIGTDIIHISFWLGLTIKEISWSPFCSWCHDCCCCLWPTVVEVMQKLSTVLLAAMKYCVTSADLTDWISVWEESNHPSWNMDSKRNQEKDSSSRLWSVRYRHT